MADPEVDLFAGMKKKKKKVVALDVEDEVPAEVAAPSASLAVPENEDGGASGTATPGDGAEAGEADGADLFADMKKKKKKKKELPAEMELATSDLPTASAEGLTKKKKSKKITTDFAKELDELDAQRGDDASAAEAAAAAAAADDDDVEGANGADAADDDEDEDDEVDAWVKEGRTATYPELLRRFFSNLHAHNPELAGEKRRYTMVPPQVAREGSKKTMFANISDICRRMHRQPEHVIAFLYSELGTSGSIDGNQRLIMKGKYTPKQIETVLRKYMVEYVLCKICKSSDTLLGRENRLYFITCESCGSRRSVSSIKAGFQAQVGRRIKAA